MKWTTMCAAMLVALPFLNAQAAPPAEHWVGTWGTSPMMVPNNPPRPMPGVTPSGLEPIGVQEETLREIVHVSIGGQSLRVVFTNEFGTAPLIISGANVALSAGGGKVQPGGKPLLFNGKLSITIPAGALAVSDPVAMTLPALSDLAVSLSLPVQAIPQLSSHGYADTTNYLAAGSVAGAAELNAPATNAAWIFLKDVEVNAPTDAASIVTFGDSITDGAYATKDANVRWPDILAQRLQANPKTKNLGIINQGIGGNRILHDTTGPNALARFTRDVLDQAGVKYVVILEGINDIGHSFDTKKPYDSITAQDLIQGYVQMVTRAHAHGIKVYGATLTPYTGAGYMSPEGEAVRVALNTWIRATPMLEGVIDFDKITRDPAHPEMYLPAYDHGDHLHPGDVGYKAMGDAIDLSLFTK